MPEEEIERHPDVLGFNKKIRGEEKQYKPSSIMQMWQELEDQRDALKAEGLSDEEIGEKIKDAERYHADDRAKRKIAELKNQAETLLYTTNKAFDEYKSKLSEFVRTDISESIKKMKDTLLSNDAEAIKKATEDLRKSSTKLAEIAFSK